MRNIRRSVLLSRKNSEWYCASNQEATKKTVENNKDEKRDEDNEGSKPSESDNSKKRS